MAGMTMAERTEMEDPRESFVFYRSFREAIAELSEENQLAILLAICDYALYGVQPELKDAVARAVFTLAKPNIDANASKRSNGKKGGRPPKKPVVSESGNQCFSKNESTEAETEAEAVTGAKADKPPRTRFVQPTEEEVRSYCRERHNGVDAATFVNYYTSNGWTVGRGKMKDWKAAVRTWEGREVGKTAGKGEFDDVI